MSDSKPPAQQGASSQASGPAMPKIDPGKTAAGSNSQAGSSPTTLAMDGKPGNPPRK